MIRDCCGAGHARAACVTMLLSLVLAACALPGPGESAQGQQTVTIMTFNVENLFDTHDDPGKTDETYLPIAAKRSPGHRQGCEAIAVEHWRDQCLNWDWNEDVLERKLSVLAEAILQVGDGRGPDIVALQEVENLAVLERLREQYLAPAGYRPAVLIEGADLRGIDVAFLSRLDLVGRARLHPIPFEGFPPERVRDTRGILEATFRLPDGALLTGFAVHFPAPFHPHEMRAEAWRFLNALRAALPADRLAFAAGDFNTTAEEDREQLVLRRLVAPTWIVAHEQGCAGCRGTHYYAPKDSWSFLDMILWARAPRGVNAPWQLRAGSAALANGTPAQRTTRDTPAAFRLPEASGVSDHWPLLVTIETSQKQ